MRKHVVLFLALLSVLFIACGNQSGQGAGSNRNENEVDLVIGANYYEVVKDDQGNNSFKYGSYLPEGSVVLLLPGEVQKADVPDSKGTLRSDMIGPARLNNGKDVFVSRYYIIPKQRLGVVIAPKDTDIYDGYKPSNVTGKTLPRLTMVAVAPAEEKDNPLKRQRFVAYNVAQLAGGKAFSAGIWTPFYVDGASVSIAASDVEMAKIINSLPRKDKSLWGKIINEAEKLYPDSVLLNDAKVLIGQGSAPVSEEKAIETVSLSGMINDDNVNLRTEPDELGGSVIGQLGKDTEVEIIAQTVNSYTVGSQTGRWYKVKVGDTEGWVFGSYLAVE